MKSQNTETPVLKAGQIAAAIEKFAPLATQEEWDNSGFTVGGAHRRVKKGLIALNCTKEVMEEAVAKGCDIVLTHHPLIVHDPLMNIIDGNPRSDAVSIAVKYGITVYSSHTPLDKAVGGLNTIMAQKLGIKSPKELVKGGFGAYGKLSKALSAKEFIALVKKSFKAANVRSSAPLKGKISTVAVSSGGGQGSVEDALRVGAQVLVTGDVTHHHFYVPDGFMIIDVGHHQSEWPAVNLLESLVKKNFPKFAVHISEADTSPVYYF